MKITTIGIDLAKNVFQIHSVDKRGKVAVRKQLKRGEMTSYFASLEPQTKSDVWLQSLPAQNHQLKAWQKWASMYGAKGLRFSAVPLKRRS